VKLAPVCHRAQPVDHGAHHCNTMVAQHPAETTQRGSESPVANGVESPENCPMDCCVGRHMTNAVTPRPASPLPAMAVTDVALAHVPVIFLSAGFSSHTDRGPPNT
jgi:hypothetical protein